MNIILLLMLILFNSENITSKNISKPKSVENIKKSLQEHQDAILAVNKSKTKTSPALITNVVKFKLKPVIPKKNKHDMPKMIPPNLVQEWAKEISEKLFENEEKVVRRDVLLKGFADIKIEIRNGSAIAENAAKSLEELLIKRGKAAENIMRRAEELATNGQKQKKYPPSDYTFDYSVDLEKLKHKVEKSIEDANVLEIPLDCRSLNKIKLHNSSHFNAQVSLETTSIHVAMEVFDCDPRVLPHMYWSEGLISAFKENYAQDATLDFQYMCDAKGFLRHYPAALWQSMYNVKIDGEDLYDCRLRPWYVSASGAPRDVLILLDASGSMNNSGNQMIAEQFTWALLSALTDDDQVNVLRFNVVVESPISCFNEKLVAANHVNSAAMMAALKLQKVSNETWMADVLTYAVQLLQKQRKIPDQPPSCQQAIVLLTDSLYDNYTSLLNRIDPEGNIRLFVLWLHDPYGLRDNTRKYGDWLACKHDGYFAELITHADVTEQVMNILRVLERPLVAQRKRRLRVYSDVYAHVEDPRRGEYYWQQKENDEQAYRYKELRRHKDKLLNISQMNKDHTRMLSLEKFGHYYEGEDVNYRLQISVSVPVFESTTLENITKTLDEEKQRNSTRTYPVNRLLGVAGVDIPLDHLKLLLPYYQVGAGGSLFIIDHRGNIVLHENTKPTFDGDILKPGYRTVDVLDLEQSAVDHLPRHYPRDWLEFRKSLVIDHPNGNITVYAKHIFESGMRALLEMREYYWRRVFDHYTIVVTLPKYNTRHAVPDAAFTQKLADKALQALSGTEFSVHPDWLYCRHVDPHFNTRESEVLHFIRRRRDEPYFAMQKLKHSFSPIQPTLLEKTYQCNEELMARLSKEAVATLEWAEEHEEPGTERDCSPCALGSTTAFFASESGLTRWQQYHATSEHASPPDGALWARGPSEPWYRRAVAAPDLLLVHAPVAPVRTMRKTEATLPSLGERMHWLTAARTLGPSNKGMIGVAGYHFHPKHLEDVLRSITNFHCAEDDRDKCEARCDGEEWSCVLIDEGGWVVSHMIDREEEPEEPVREHLANMHPAAMAALLNASVFKLRWIHDYQGVCFPPKNEKLKGSAALLSSILRSLWTSVKLIFDISVEMVTIITILSSSARVTADTEEEKKKRRKRVWKDFEREKYERLYDRRVLVNRTRFAACDRSRALYELQRNTKAMEMLKRPAELCSWPLVAALVPRTNLLLLAVYNDCPHTGRPVNDPYVNELVEMMEDTTVQGSASRLACWRNRVPLPPRPPHTTCFPHDYCAEEGYRQCGPWLPDPEVEDIAANTNLSKLLLVIAILLFMNSS